MGVDTKIEWAHHTFNHVRGCTKVSPGCTNCYAETLSHRNPGTLGVWGPNGTRVVASEAKWREPLKWDREAKRAGERRRVFCASLADVFEDWDGPVVDSKGRVLHYNSAATWWVSEATMHGPITLAFVRQRLFSLIDATPNLDWLVLTKRPENAARLIPWGWGSVESHQQAPATVPLAFGAGTAPKGDPIRPNVWLGTTVEDQARADGRIPHLLATPAAVRFLSVEPLLEPVRLPFFEPTTERERLAVVAAAEAFGGIPEDSLNAQLSRYYTAAERGIHWVIVGGESGHGARPCEPEWIRSIRDQCQSAGVPVFVKQMGSHWASAAQAAVVAEWESRRDSDAPEWAGPRPEIDRKGGDWSEWPADLRVREFPVIAEDDGDSCPDLFSHVHG